MNDSSNDFIRKIIGEFDKLSYISPEDVPDIALYMDQITTFMDTRLDACKRHPDDKILTKTMINNYTKSKLIPPPEKKKYTQDHLLLLIYVYYLKDFLQISDIRTLLSPLTDPDPTQRQGKSMLEIYEAAFKLVKSQTDYMTKDLMRRWKMARDIYGGGNDQEVEYLQVFAFVCLLSFDVYVKKNLIESIVDEISKFEESGDS